MAPRKQKGESAKGGGAKTGESSSKKTKVRDTLLADTRPGSGPQLEKEIEEANAMNEQVKKALLGYARFDILQNCDVLKFGKWNPRQLLPSQVAALGNSFLINGVDRFNYSYAMPLVMDKSSIEEGSYMPTPDAGPNLPELKLRDGLPKDFKITAAGGQHRVAALKDWYAKKKAQLEECIKEQQAILSADAYEARFTIQLAMENLPSTAYPNITDASFRQACYAADVAFKVYFEDVKKLVYNGITSELTPQLSSPQLAVRQSARERQAALSRWMDEKHPLSYNTGILSNLLQAITQPENGKFELTTSVLGKKPTTFIADIMIKQCSRVGNQNQPPFIKGGNFLQVARVAIEEIGKAATRSYGEFVRNLEWVERDRKGARHAGRFITMVSGFIICLFETGSPIGLRIQRGEETSAWWAKHTAKGINAFLLVRLGLASIASASGFRSAKWNKDIIPLNTDRIKERHAEVVRLMRTGGKYGGFDAVRYLAGMNAARILATNHYVTSRTLPMSNMGGSSSKRNTREWEVDDGIEMGPIRENNVDFERTWISRKNGGVENAMKNRESHLHIIHREMEARIAQNSTMQKCMK
ncbi:hypothetical protein PISMIDRAFT_23793 [Pisolithus microcarpus 441]|uniref:Uncharacterized protein n=1 Tax=Pisolithus microcarpus 441 TaxID=765257 RepID=A0A0C9ZI23_9AGAM|nr:hypothetical protein PISMIDRAFT_23793 [Pisolithus microcarpus 441]